MSESYVDLHCHSTASDGTLSPTEVARLARSSDLSGFALTDHDTIAGVAEAAEEATTLGLDFIPGIEISCEFPAPGTMHLLGYGIDPHSEDLKNLTRQLLEGRDNRNPRIISRLNELGLDISMAEVEQEAGGTVIGRPHIAAILLRKGYVHSIKQAFNVYLAPGGSAYFDKERVTAADAISLIHKAGGLVVMAHPVQLRTSNSAELEQVVRNLVELGLAGIEVIHSDHNGADIELFESLAKKYNLLTTGGSDFHGSTKKDIKLGRAAGRRIPRAYFDRLAERINSTHAAQR